MFTFGIVIVSYMSLLLFMGAFFRFCGRGDTPVTFDF